MPGPPTGHEGMHTQCRPSAHHSDGDLTAIITLRKLVNSRLRQLQGLVDSRVALDSGGGSDSDASAGSGYSPAVSPAASPCIARGHLVYRTPFFWQRVSHFPEAPCLSVCR